MICFWSTLTADDFIRSFLYFVCLSQSLPGLVHHRLCKHIHLYHSFLFQLLLNSGLPFPIRVGYPLGPPDVFFYVLCYWNNWVKCFNVSFLPTLNHQGRNDEFVSEVIQNCQGIHTQEQLWALWATMGKACYKQGSTLAVARWPGATRNWFRATKLSKKLHFGGPIGQLTFQSDDVMRITSYEPNITAIHFRP